MVYKDPLDLNLKEEIWSGMLDLGSRQSLLQKTGAVMCSASLCGLIIHLPSQVERDLLFHQRILENNP